MKSSGDQHGSCIYSDKSLGRMNEGEELSGILLGGLYQKIVLASGNRQVIHQSHLPESKLTFPKGRNRIPKRHARTLNRAFIPSPCMKDTKRLSFMGSKKFVR